MVCLNKALDSHLLQQALFEARISRLEFQLVCRHTHTNKHTHTQLYPHHNPISVPHWWCRLSFPGCHRWAAWVTAVIHQWRLINQKCQQHLLLHHAVTMVTRGGDGWDLPQLCPLLSVTQGPCQSVPVNATLNWQGYISQEMDCFPKCPSSPYGASGERWKLSSSYIFMKISADTKHFVRFVSWFVFAVNVYLALNSAQNRYNIFLEFILLYVAVMVIFCYYSNKMLKNKVNMPSQLQWSLMKTLFSNFKHWW